MSNNNKFNPFILDANITINGVYQEVPVGNCNYIRLYPVSGNAKIFINDVDNLPPFMLYEATDLENKDGRVNRLIVYSSGSTTTNIKMIRYPGSEVVRSFGG